MTDIDWGGGEWWQELPPPPDEPPDEEGGEWFDDEDFSPDDVPPEPEWFAYSSLDPTEGDDLPEEVYDAWDFLVDMGKVNPAEIRGTAFTTVYEAFNWLQGLGLLGFSSITYSDGFYYPVVHKDSQGNIIEDVSDTYDPLADFPNF